MNWNNYVWLLAGSQLQSPMSKEIKANGYDLLITDGNSNCFCKDYADHFEKIDTYDLDANVAFLVKLMRKGYKPKSILTDSADIGITVSTLCQIAELPSTPLDIACTINNKLSLRQALKKPGYPVWINSTNLWCSEAWVEWIKKCSEFEIPTFPLIFKPTSNCASRGIKRINNLAEFERYYYEVTQHNKNNSQEMIIEQFLTGEECATDWFVGGGTPIYVNGAKRIFDKQFGIELGHINPWFPIPDKITKLAQDLCDKTGYEFGPLKIDFINDVNYGWCILEAATRWSGGYDHGFTAKVSTDRNLEKPLLDFALGKEGVLVKKIDDTHKYSAAIGFNHDISLITKDKVDQLYKIKGFVQHYYNYNDKRTVVDNADRNVFIITQGESEESAWQAALTAKQSLLS